MGTLHLLTLGFHVTQNKFATRKLLIFHKCSTMPSISAEWPMYMDLIQKLPLFVSFIAVRSAYTAVASYLIVPTWHFDWVLRVWTRYLSKGIPVSINILRVYWHYARFFSILWIIGMLVSYDIIRLYLCRER